MNKRALMLDSLLYEWKDARPEYKKFCEDGILIERAWEIAYPKTMFLLKESYGDFVIIRGQEHGPIGGGPHFWRQMRMWTFLIEKIIKEKNIPDFRDVERVKETPNRSVSYVNIKKNVENNKNSNYGDILNYARRDKHYLVKQIELIDPDIILCCGTFCFCDSIFDDLESVSENLHVTGGRWLIDFFHPSWCDKTYRETLADLAGIVQDIDL